MGILLKTFVLLGIVYSPPAVSISEASQPKQSSTSNGGERWLRPSSTRGTVEAQAEETEFSGNALSGGASAVSSLSADSSKPAIDSGSHDLTSERVTCFGYSFVRHTTKHFQLLYRDRSSSNRIVCESCDLLEKVYREFYAGFSRAGFKLQAVAKPLPWIVFDSQSPYRDFARIADGMESPSLESYYSVRSNQVVLMQAAVNQVSHERHCDRDSTPAVVESWLSGMDRLPQKPNLPTGGGGMLEVRRAAHEAAHQLAFNSGLQKRGVMYPLWVSEGLATNFEADSLRAVGVARANFPRQRQLLAAHRAARLMPLKSFVSLVQIPLGNPEAANDLYAESWALFNFLFKTRRAELRAYFQHLSDLETGPRTPEAMRYEFTSTFGSIEAIERSWLDSIDAFQIRGDPRSQQVDRD